MLPILNYKLSHLNACMPVFRMKKKFAKIDFQGLSHFKLWKFRSKFQDCKSRYLGYGTHLRSRNSSVCVIFTVTWNFTVFRKFSIIFELALKLISLNLVIEVYAIPEEKKIIDEKIINWARIMIIEFHGAWNDFLIHIIFSSLSYITRLSFSRLDVADFLPQDTNLDKIEAFKVALYHLCKWPKREGDC